MKTPATHYSKILKDCKGEAVAFDYETTGFNPITKRVFAYVLTNKEGNSEVYDLDLPGKKGKIARKVLKGFFKDTSITKIAHNLKFELHFTLRAEGIKIPRKTIFEDTMLMSQISDNLEKSHKLEDLTQLYCNDKKLKRHWKETDKKVKFQAAIRGKRWDRVDRDLMHKYQENDGFRTMLLYKLYKPLIKPYWENYRYEVETVIATQRMEDFGLQPSAKNIDEMISWLTSETDQMYDKLFPLMNSLENYNSDEIVREYLYDIKEYPIYAYTDKGKPSVDKEVFFRLLAEFPEDKKELNLLAKYRAYLAGLATVQGYRNAIKPDGLIHHNVNTNSARTGRASASKPNMQNVAKKNAMKVLFPVPARKCFVPRKDSFLLFVDYKGVEMRLIIGATGEPTMTRVLQDGGDIHTIASEYWFGDLFTDQETCLKEYLPLNETLLQEYNKMINEIGIEQADIDMYAAARYILRGAGKNSQFALAYGAEFEVIRKAANMPASVLRPGYDAYCQRFPLIANFTPASMHLARKDGFVMTAFGRRLYIEKSRIHTAANYCIQGTAAEMLKRSTVKLDNFLIDNYPDIRIEVPIHDELMIDCPNTYVRNIKELTLEMGNKMTVFPELTVPIEVEWEASAKTWNDKIGLDKFLFNYTNLVDVEKIKNKRSYK